MIFFGNPGNNLLENLGGKFLSNPVELAMIRIPGGSFQMGDTTKEYYNAQPIHLVTIAPFFLGKPITQIQYQAIMGNQPAYFKGANRPVENISWDDAIKFCRGLADYTGKPYRLPTEAEWEYACRAGSQGKYGFGDEDSLLGDYGWYNENSQSQTHLVGEKKPNQWGLYDMHGNVKEWCSDRWHSNYDRAPSDGSSWETGTDERRVFKGGSWYYSDGICGAGVRHREFANTSSIDSSFRVACAIADEFP